MEKSIYIPGRGEVARHLRDLAREAGANVTESAQQRAEYAILEIPTRELPPLPEGATVFGGGALLRQISGQRSVDLLEDEVYQIQNGALTARCATALALREIPQLPKACPVLVMGYGRIGKVLAREWANLGASVTIAARKETDRAMARGLGYAAISTGELAARLHEFLLIYNTVPHMLINAAAAQELVPEAVAIDLASTPGIDSARAISARGLPGKMAAKQSAERIFARVYAWIAREGEV